MSTIPATPPEIASRNGQKAAHAPAGERGETIRSEIAVSHARVLDTAAYGLVIAGIYGLIGPLFYMGAKEKIFDAVPAGITKMFSGTFVSSFPGTDVAWFLVGLLEAAVVVTLLISLARGEFMIRRTKPWLLVSIALSMFAYAVVAFGDTIASQFDGTASLFMYFATSAALVVLVLLMPPYRPTAWLSSLGHR